MKIPPRMTAVVDMDINTSSKDKVLIVPDEYCAAANPNMYMYSFQAELAKKRKNDVTPFAIIILS